MNDTGSFGVRSGGRGVAAVALGVVFTIAGAGTAASAAAPPGRAGAALSTAASTTAPTRCSATGVLTTTRYLRQLPKVPQAKAITLLRAASSCDSKTLIAIAKKDRTRLTFGITAPATQLAVPDTDGRYRALVIMFTRMKATVERIGSRTVYTWPPLHVKTSAAGWREVVKAGLLTQQEANAMRREVGGYWGWRTSIDPKGGWEYNVAGD